MRTLIHLVERGRRCPAATRWAYLRISGLTPPVKGPNCQLMCPHCAQNADHLAHDGPFSELFTEVVCTVGTTPLTLAHQTGDLHYMSVRHADDTQPEGFM